MSTEDTRDIAIGAETKIDAHLTDCATYRQSTETKLIKINDKIDKINWFLPLIIGGLVVLTHVPEWLNLFAQHLAPK